jgi:hypothetical protein
MAVLLGRVQTAAFNDGGGYDEIGKIVDGSLELESAEVTITNHDSGLWEEFLQGRSNATMTLSCRYDETDAGQEAALAAWTAQTAGTCRFRMGGAAGTKQYSASAFVKSAPLNAPNDDAADLQLTFRLTGAITRGAVA